MYPLVHTLHVGNFTKNVSAVAPGEGVLGNGIVFFVGVFYLLEKLKKSDAKSVVGCTGTHCIINLKVITLIILEMCTHFPNMILNM